LFGDFYRQIESLVEDKYVYRMKLTSVKQQHSNALSELDSLKANLETMKMASAEDRQLKGVDYSTCSSSQESYWASLLFGFLNAYS